MTYFEVGLAGVHLPSPVSGGGSFLVRGDLSSEHLWVTDVRSVTSGEVGSGGSGKVR